MENNEIGSRLVVFDLSGASLGFGTLEGLVTIYLMSFLDHNILNEAPEQEPSPEQLAEVASDYSVNPDEINIIEVEDTPKIRLEDGLIVYGCQVYWHQEDLSITPPGDPSLN